MRAMSWSVLLVLAACETDTGFQDKSEQPTDLEKGALAIDTTALEIDNMDVGFAKSESFTITSTGEDNLKIYSAKLVANPDAVFTFDDRDDVEVIPGESVEWAVAAVLPAEGMVEGQLRIDSNDPNQPRIFLPICARTRDYVELCPVAGDTGDTGSGGDTGDTADTADSGI